MSKTLLFTAGILFCLSAEAQSVKGFISPQMTFSTELFPQKEKSVAFLSMMPEPKSMSVSTDLNATVSTLPQDYDLSKQIRREQSIKRAAVVPYSSDPLGRSPLPDAGRLANEQMQMRNMRTR